MAGALQANAGAVAILVNEDDTSGLKSIANSLHGAGLGSRFTTLRFETLDRRQRYSACASKFFESCRDRHQSGLPFVKVAIIANCNQSARK
ncbi:hypothetical protein BLA27_03835 [Brucella cytisi]|uniref:Uncharacterized protein n=1 Tax=Brucella cytisi TaxID=407152 RepID=A0A1J6HRT9_9HYPH|nr:hypothetical protein BLA27_03835 [Brucella cytisi]